MPRRPVVSLLSQPIKPDAVSIVAAAARLCRRPTTIQDLAHRTIPRREEIKLVKTILRSRHLSCLRHVNLVFGIEGVSRSFSHQMVRHTAGHSYEQQSQHFICENPGVFQGTPPNFSEEFKRRSAQLVWNKHMRDKRTFETIRVCLEIVAKQLKMAIG